jgi:hypothetical protein
MIGTRVLKLNNCSQWTKTINGTTINYPLGQRARLGHGRDPKPRISGRANDNGVGGNITTTMMMTTTTTTTTTTTMDQEALRSLYDVIL